MIAQRLETITTKYKVNVIIKSLETHRDNHSSQYHGALVEYRKLMKERAAEALKKLENGEDYIVQANFGLTKPINKIDEYNNIINIFRLMEEDIIELDMSQADSVFNDNWGWIKDAKNLIGTYLSSAESRRVF